MCVCVCINSTHTQKDKIFMVNKKLKDLFLFTLGIIICPQSFICSLIYLLPLSLLRFFCYCFFPYVFLGHKTVAPDLRKVVFCGTVKRTRRMIILLCYFGFSHKYPLYLSQYENEITSTAPALLGYCRISVNV